MDILTKHSFSCLTYYFSLTFPHFSLFISLCQEGKYTDWYTFGDSEYYVAQNPTLRWDEARKTCKWLGGDLATIRSAEENSFIWDLISKQKSVTEFGAWIGLYRKGDSKFYWVDDTPLQYTEWKPGQPDNSGGVEDCVNVNGGKWNDLRCDAWGDSSRAPVTLCQRFLKGMYFFFKYCSVSSVHPFIHSFIHSFVRSFVRSFIHSFIHSIKQSLILPFIRSILPSFLPSVCPSFPLPSFLRSFLPSILPSFLPPFPPILPPSFLPYSFLPPFHPSSFLSFFLPSFILPSSFTLFSLHPSFIFHSFIFFIHSFICSFVPSFLHFFICLFENFLFFRLLIWYLKLFFLIL